MDAATASVRARADRAGVGGVGDIAGGGNFATGKAPPVRGKGVKPSKGRAKGAKAARGPESSGALGCPNLQEVMNCVAADDLPRRTVATWDPFDRAHDKRDSHGRLLPAAAVGDGRRVKPLVQWARPRVWSRSYVRIDREVSRSAAGELVERERIVATIEQQADDLYERQRRLEGIAGVGYSASESAVSAERAMARFEASAGRRQLRALTRSFGSAAPSVEEYVP